MQRRHHAKEAIRPTGESAELSLLPAKVDLYAAEIELVYIDSREYRLKRILEQVRATTTSS